MTVASQTLSPVGSPIVLGSGQTSYINPLTGLTESVPAGLGVRDTIYVYQLPFSEFSPAQTTDVRILAPVSSEANIYSPLVVHITPGFLSETAQLDPPPIVGAVSSTDVTPIPLVQLRVQKGAVAATDAGLMSGTGANQIIFAAASNPGGTLTLAGLPLSAANALYSSTQAGLIGSLNISPTNLPVQGSQTIRYALVVQNTERTDAYNVSITDQLPTGYVIPGTSAGLNLRVYRGDGTLLTESVDYTLDYVPATGRFTIQLVDNYTSGNVNNADLVVDSGTGALSRGRAVKTDGSQEVEITNGSNTILVFYDAVLANTVAANQTISNTAQITAYTGFAGSIDNDPLSITFNPDITDSGVFPGASDPSESATVQIISPSISTTLLGTSIIDTNNSNTQAVIGELVDYRLRIRVPQGVTPGASIVVTLPSGLAFLQVQSVSFVDAFGSATTGLSTANSIGTGTSPSSVLIQNNGQLLTFQTGTLSNSNTDGMERYLQIDLQAVVLNSNSNTQGATLSSSATLSFTGQPTTPLTSASAAVSVVEPQLTVAKTVTINGQTNPGQSVTGQAGDAIRYGFMFTPAANRPTAQNVTFTDVLSVGWNGGSVIASPVFVDVIVTGSPLISDGINPAVTLTAGNFTNYFEIVGSLATGFTVQTVAGASFSLVEGQGISFAVSGVVSQNVRTGSTLASTSTVRWQSLNAVSATQQGPLSNHNSNSYERTGLVGAIGAVNNYSATSTATFSTPGFAHGAVIVTTSEASTAETGGTTVTPRPVTIGEIVRYRLVVQIAQGTTPNLSFINTLPGGLAFLGNVQVATVSSSPSGTLTTTLGSVFNIDNTGNPALDPLLVTGANSLTSHLGWTNLANLTTIPAVGSTGTLTFNLGSVTNTDTDSSRPEYVVLEFNALVRNITSNIAGTRMDSSFLVGVNGSPDTGASNTVSVQVVEPWVTISKTAQNLTAGTAAGTSIIGDAGDIIRYTVVLSSIGNATAFNVSLNDVLPNRLGSLSITGVSGGGFGLSDFTISGSILQTAQADGITLVPGTVVTITVQGTLLDQVAPAEVILNTANLSWTSLPDSGTPAGSQPGSGTGQTTPGVSGSSTGERDGSGLAPNDYAASANATVRVPNGSIVKTLIASSLPTTTGLDLAIGEEATYELTISLPEGTVSSIVVADTLPLGMSYVSGSVVVITTGLGGTLSTEEVNYDPVTRVLTITFPNPGAVVTGDNTDTNNSFQVRYTTRVLNIPSNSGIGTQTTLRNTARLTAGSLATTVTSNEHVVTLVEPRLQAAKTLLNADTTVDAGTVMNYRVIITHTGFSRATAYNVRISDLLSAIGLSNLTNLNITAPTYATVTDNSTSAAIDISIDEFRRGDTITLTYSATLNGPGAAPAVVPEPGTTVTNTIRVNYDSAPLNTPESRSEPEVVGIANFTVNTYSISGSTYEDRDNNGIRAAVGEPLIVGQEITYRLIGTDVQGNAVDRSLTTSTGLYLFDKLRPGNYRVLQITQPTGYFDGTDTSGGLGLGRALPFGGTGASPTLAGKFDPAGSVLGVIGGSIIDIVIPENAEPGFASEGINYNFGELPPSSIGNRVWLDLNANGLQDVEETGVANISVTLTGANEFGAIEPQYTTTDINGQYSFVNLRPGTYRVTFGNSDGTTTYIRTFQNVGGVLTGTNSAADRITGETGDIILGGGHDQIAVDMGLFLYARVGDRVWYDVNNNTIQDIGEPGLANITVTLNGTDGGGNSVILTTTTDTNGSYLFSNVTPGIYTVSISSAQLTALNNLGFAPSNSSNQSTSPPYLLSDEVDLERDFGFTGIGSIGSMVWYDLNRNGLRDNNEPGIAGVNLTVTGTIPGLPGTFSWLSTTNSAGTYSQPQLPFGTYTVTVDADTLPAGVRVNTYDFTNGTVNPTNSAVVVLTSATPINSNINFGYTGNGSLGDRVWLDQNADGIQNSSEPGLSGVQVQLTWAGPDGSLTTTMDNVTLVTMTGMNGLYTFTHLPPGVFRVQVIAGSVPAGLVNSGNPVGGGNGSNETSLSVDVPTNTVESRQDQDFGYRGMGSLSGTVYVDANNDGLKHLNEPGIAGTILVLTGTDIFGNTHLDPLTGHPFQIITDSSGFYNFSNLPPGVYTITEIQPAGWAQGRNTLGTINGIPQGTVVPVDQLAAIPLGPGQNGIDYLFGEGGGQISGLVWLDRNQNGIVDTGEPGLAGVQLTLQTTTGQTVADPLTGIPYVVITDSTGRYLFANLPAGTYRVVQTQPIGYGNSTGTPATVRDNISLNTGEQYLNAHFGETLGQLSGLVYFDQNRNGVRDLAETGIAGVVLTLSGIDITGMPVLRTTTTGMTGTYTFEDLLASDANGYMLSQQQPTGYQQGATTAGNQGGVIVGDQIRSINFMTAANATGYLFGEQAPSTTAAFVFGTVFVDRNRNGILNAGEPGVSGVTIRLLNATGSIVETTTTNGDGTYSFNSVTPGSYTIQQVQLGGYGSSTPVNRAVTVTSAGLLNQNFGNTVASLSGIVYFDSNANGVQETGEPGISGTLITLTGIDVLGSPVSLTTTTDSNGRYTFSNLLAGNYTLTQTQPAAYNQGSNTVGSVGGILGPGIDIISTIPLGAGVNASGYNFGELGTSLSGRVWLDSNRDGLVGASEPALRLRAGHLVAPGTVGGTSLPGSFTNILVTSASFGQDYNFALIR